MLPFAAASRRTLQALLTVGLLGVVGGLVPNCPAQDSQQSADSPGLSILDQLGSFAPAIGGNGGELQFKGRFELEEGNARTGRVVIEAELAPGWHVYSITQRPGGPQQSKLNLIPAEQFELTGPFQPSKPPRIEHYEFWPNLDVEEHHESLAWTAPLRLAEGTNPDELKIVAAFSGQVCKEGVCLPVNKDEIPVSYSGTYQAVRPTDAYRTELAHVTWRGKVSSSVVAPGQTITLQLEASPDEGWHIYAYEASDPNLLTKPTLIKLPVPSGWSVGKVSPSAEPHVEETQLEQQPLSHYYESPVTWSLDITIPEDAQPGRYPLTGEVAYQTCTATLCDMPTASQFHAELQVAEAAPASSTAVALAFSKQGSYSDVSDALSALRAPESATASGGTVAEVPARSGSLNLDQLDTQSDREDLSLAVVVLMAFGAGLILNFMPCVLPVIGLKVMAFVQQSGESRGKIFTLNLWYCAGLMSVFLVLATLAVFVGVGWGQQFSNSTFNIVLTGVVFAFALSFLGVWEIPLPGFVGSGKMSEMSTQEGASGAFFKGVLTTILATPCGGPMLAPALTWFIGQTPFVAYVGFCCVGLGMASPYLLIGAFPKLVSFLPKPGAWMDTFKQSMGFVLLGTAVFLLTFLEIPWVIPTVAFVIGLWAALWWVGRVPITASTQAKLRGWLAGAAFATAVGLFSFTFLHDVMESRFRRAVDRVLVERNSGDAAVLAPEPRADGHELPWRPFSLGELQALTDTGHTVLVDFTADW